MHRIPFLEARLASVILTLAAVDARAAMPRVESVEAQPLLAQATRLSEALAYLGSPLSAVSRRQLDQVKSLSRLLAIVAAVQDALDPLCLSAVSIDADGKLSCTSSNADIPLQEQGWTTHLVKVINMAQSRSSLGVTSPNAGPLPNATPEQVAVRWLDLQMYNSRPLKPRLSGLELEYRIIQIYSKDAGQRSAGLSFHLGSAELPDTPNLTAETRTTGIIREWNFDSGAEGWRELRDITLSVTNGALHGEITDRDPSMAIPITAPGGKMVVRFSAKSSVGSFGQVFWSTRNKPQFDGNRRVNFMLEQAGGQWRDYAIPFTATGSLNALRLDLGGKPGHVEVDWIQLSYADSGRTQSKSVSLTFYTFASMPVMFRVLDENSQPGTASFVITDDHGRIYPAPGKRLAPDFFFHSQIYRHDGETVRLPIGQYTIACSRGPESIPENRQLAVNGESATFRYQVKRWVDPAKLGWYSGDHHIHAAGCKHYANPTEGVLAEHMARHTQGEDLKIGANLTWGPGFDYQKQFFTGKLDPASRYPYLLRYDVEVSGFGSHRSGHLCLLRLKEQIFPGGDSKDHWPTLGLSTLKWAKRQGAITGPAHSAIGLASTGERTPGIDGPNGLPNFFIPRHDGIGANEYIVDITHNVPGPDGKLVPAVDFISTMDTDRTAEFNMWYHTLNCGFRVRASGETDFPCISGDRVGKGRVYAKVDGRLDYDRWCEEIRNGRSYVSDGFSHLMEFKATTGSKTVAVGEQSSELRLPARARIKLTAKVAARTGKGKTVPLEVIVNGYPTERRDVTNDGREEDVEFDIEITKSGWVALRIFPSSHTNPIFILVEDKPIRSKASAQWFRNSVDQLWLHKQRTYAEAEQSEAKAAYDHARKYYDGLIAEADDR